MTKVIRNPARQTPSGERVPRKYVPEYRRMNWNPVQINLPTITGDDLFDDETQRAFPQEQMVMDGDVVYEDEELDSDATFEPTYAPPPVQPKQAKAKAASTASLAVGEYILMVKNQIMAKGPLDKVRSVLSLIMYGEHASFKDVNLEPEDIIVLKRMDVEFGVLIK